MMWLVVFLVALGLLNIWSNRLFVAISLPTHAMTTESHGTVYWNNPIKFTLNFSTSFLSIVFVLQAQPVTGR